MLFRRLKGRRVIVNLTTGDAIRGTVIGSGLISIRVSSSELEAAEREFDVIDGRTGKEGLAHGVARIPFWSIAFLQEL